MNVLVFTSLFPNNVWPHHGVFVKERMVRVARLPGISMQVMAPVPYFPPLRLGHRWHYSQVRHGEEIEGLPVLHPRYFMIPKISTRWHGSMMFRSLLPVARRLQRRFDFDVIDAHYVYPDGYASVEIGRRLGRPVVVSARGSDVNLFREMPAVRSRLKETLARADAVIAVSGALQRAMIELGTPAEKITVIPNGVDPAKFHPMPRAHARARLGLPEGRLILSVGHLTENKGFDRLLHAFRALVNQGGHEDARVAIVGEGSYRRELVGLAGFLGLTGRLVMPGEIPHDELHLWYSAADLSCLFSRREGWPNVVLESMACGTPVLATPVGGIPEIVNSQAVGALVEGDETALSRGLSEALAAPWDRTAIARYADGHSWDRAASSVRAVFESVVRQAGASRTGSGARGA